MKDDAAKILVYIILASVVLGFVVLGGFYAVTGKPYTAEYCLESNVQAGFYPYNPPTAVPGGEDEPVAKK